MGEINKQIAYDSVDDANVLLLINAVRQGIEYARFQEWARIVPFSIPEWSIFLHISHRTMQRYKKENGAFDALQSERILQILMLYKLGVDIFGDPKKFDQWLEMESVALGSTKPKDLMDSTFGIDLLRDELNRIEQGVLA